MGLKLYAAPASEPVTTDELKAHLRVDFSDDDTLIAALGKAAREQAEVFLRRAILTQTWDLTLDNFPAHNGWLTVPSPPLQSITSIAYTDTDGATQTLDPSAYLVDTFEEPARVAPAYGTTWPVTRAQIAAVAVRFVAGWTSAASVPELVKLAIKLAVSTWYDLRSDAAVGERGQTVLELPKTAEILLWNYRIPAVA